MTAIALRSSAASVATSAPVKASKPSNKPAVFASGKGAPARNIAFGDVSTFAYIEGKSRAETVATLRTALGAKPTDAQVASCREAYIIGRVAARLMAGDGIAAHLDNASDIVLRFAAPVKDGVKARKLRAGQKGRRSIDQHKAVRAAEEAWSLIKAEVAPALSSAATQADRNKAKRAPAAPGSTARGNKPSNVGQGITHSELVKPDGAPMTADAAAAYVTQMAATMLAFCNKHGAVVPTAFGASVKRFHGAIMEAAKERDALKGTEA